MITIALSPLFSDEPPVVLAVRGDVIVINGEVFDFSPLPDGYTLPADAVDSPWFAGPIAKDADGSLALTIRYPHPIDAGEDMRFPVPIVMHGDGEVPVPLYVPTVTESLPPLEGQFDEDRLQFGSESADSVGLGSTEQKLGSYPVPAIDGLDGDSPAGDVEAGSGVGAGEAGTGPDASDRGDQ